MKIGQSVRVRAHKADGTCYRWWHAIVEAVEANQVILITPVGHRVEGISGGWTSSYAIRAFYWSNRPYSLLEAYAPDGRLTEIYVNISSPAEIAGAQVSFTDYELDVSRKPPQGAVIEDEDEFLEAACEYGYSKEFQEACYQVAWEAVGLANNWIARGMPDSCRQDSSFLVLHREAMRIT